MSGSSRKLPHRDREANRPGAYDDDEYNADSEPSAQAQGHEPGQYMGPWPPVAEGHEGIAISSYPPPPPPAAIAASSASDPEAGLPMPYGRTSKKAKKNRLGEIFTKSSDKLKAALPSPLPSKPTARNNSSSNASQGNLPHPAYMDNEYEDGDGAFAWDKDDQLEEDQMDDEIDKDEAKKRERMLRRTRCGVFLAWFLGFPFYLRTLLYIVVSNAFILTPGLIDFYFFADSKYGLTPEQNKTITFRQRFDRLKSPLSIFGIALFQYAVFLSICVTLFFVIRFGVRIAPKLILKVIELVMGTYGTNTKHVLEYVRSLHSNISFAVWMWALYTTFKALLVPSFWRPNGGEHRFKDPALENLVNNVLLSGAIGAALLAGEKLIVQIIAVRFQRRAYADRMRENKHAAHVLEMLENYRKHTKISNRLTVLAGGSNSSSLTYTAPPQSRDMKPFLSEMELDNVDRNTDGEDGGKLRWGRADARRRQRKKKGVVQGISHFVTETVLQTDWSIAALASKDDARRLARKLFEAYCPPHRNHLRSEDFDGVFATDRERDDAFRIFDKDGNGDISKAEMKASVLGVYREQKVIDRSLRSVNSAVGKLDSIFTFFLVTVVVLITLGIFNISPEAFLTSVGSLLLAATFMFGGTVKTLFESAIFLFVTHPYDVGDRVDIAVSNSKPLNLIVHDMGLLTTVFRSVDGKEYYAPNIVLATQFIHNVRRSGNQSDQIIMYAAATTSYAELQRFRKCLHDFLSKDGRDFTGKFEVAVEELLDMQKMILRIIVEHRSNWQDGPKKRSRTGKLHLAIRDAANAAGLHYWLPTQVVAFDPGEGGSLRLQGVEQPLFSATPSVPG